MSIKLVELEVKALALKESGNLEEAIALYSEIVQLQPNYEHGMAYYNIAGCYEDLGELASARENYELALKYGVGDPVILGGYASFLFLHGSPEEAFKSYSELLTIEINANSCEGIAAIKSTLNELGQRIGMSQKSIDDKVCSIIAINDQV